MVWVDSPKGIFSVRSAYGVAVRLSSNPNHGACSDSGQARQFWKRVWALPLPHKTRHFAWRACRGILPMKVNLLKRKVLQDGLCDGCRMEMETTGHVFISCPRAREVWAYSKMFLPGAAASMSSFHDLMWRLLMMDWVDEEKVARVVTLAWVMWHHRNEVRMGSPRKSGNELVNRAAHYLEEFWVANEAQPKDEVRVQEAMKWTPPPRNFFKVNVDGAVAIAQKRAGVGVIVRDDLGRMEAAMCKNLDAPLGAIKTKAKAIEARLLFAQDIGVRDIVIESYSLILIQALKELSPPPSSVSAIVQGILDLTKAFRNMDFSHVKRQANKSAHVLAKHALGIVDFVAWIEETP